MTELLAPCLKREAKKKLPVWFAAAVLLYLALVAGAAAQKKLPPPHSIDLNSATAEQLQQLPGIGPTLAKAIVHLREKSGPFRRVEDLLAVPRITRRTLEKIRPYVTVGQTKGRTRSDERREILLARAENGNSLIEIRPCKTENRKVLPLSEAPLYPSQCNRSQGANSLHEQDGLGEKPRAEAERREPQDVMAQFAERFQARIQSG